MPGVIDEIPALAALAAMLPPGTELTVRGAAELRVKESDRITALALGFRALGVDVDECPDGFHLALRGRCTAATVDACGDHRLAMAFAIAATRADGPDDDHRRVRRSTSRIPASSTTLERLTRGDGRQDLSSSASWPPARRPWRGRWPGGSAGAPRTSTS